jgi:uncharacterized membrane protein YgcG
MKTMGGTIGALALMLLGVSCSGDRTMLVVRVQSNLAVPDALDTVRVVVTHGGKDIQNLPFPLTGGTHKLPLLVGLLSPSGGGADVAITVTGLKARVPIVSEDAITSFIKGKSLVLDIFLAAECVAFDCQDPNKTCTVGQVCVDKKRVASTLPVFEAHAPDASADKPDAKDGASGAGGAGGAGAGGAGGSGAGGSGSGGGGAAGQADASSDAPVDAAPEARSDGPGGVEVAPEVPPACVPIAEDCFNGKDDDCDGKPDCADPDCTPTTVCVPRPSGSVGTTVAGAAACPAGFAASPMVLSSNLMPGGTSCTGCRCTPATPLSCRAGLSTYPDAASCQANTNAKSIYTVATNDPDPCPVPDMTAVNIYGMALTAWSPQGGGCAPSGAPVKPMAMFATATKFCGAEKFGATASNGCMAGWVCMPKLATGRSCLLLDAAGTCPTGTTPPTADLLYTGIGDNRVCAACSCNAASTGCENVIVRMGSDYSCGVNSAEVGGNARTCNVPMFGVYTPGFQVLGAPAAPTCNAVSALSGTLSPTGQRSLCCVP